MGGGFPAQPQTLKAMFVKVEISIRQKEDGTFGTYVQFHDEDEELPEAAKFEIVRGVAYAEDVLNGKR